MRHVPVAGPTLLTQGTPDGATGAGEPRSPGRMLAVEGFAQWRARLVRRLMFRVVSALHVALYRRTGGRLGGSIAGTPTLLLTVTGRKTGKRRTTPLGYFMHDRSYVVIASAGGAPRHPAWFLNLRANLRATIQVKDRRLNVHAEVATGELRARLWDRLMQVAPIYGRYAGRTRREIPLVLLRPLGR